MVQHDDGVSLLAFSSQLLTGAVGAAVLEEHGTVDAFLNAHPDSFQMRGGIVMSARRELDMAQGGALVKPRKERVRERELEEPPRSGQEQELEDSDRNRARKRQHSARKKSTRLIEEAVETVIGLMDSGSCLVRDIALSEVWKKGPDGERGPMAAAVHGEFKKLAAFIRSRPELSMTFPNLTVALTPSGRRVQQRLMRARQEEARAKVASEAVSDKIPNASPSVPAPIASPLALRPVEAVADAAARISVLALLATVIVASVPSKAIFFPFFLEGGGCVCLKVCVGKVSVAGGAVQPFAAGVRRKHAHRQGALGCVNRLGRHGAGNCGGDSQQFGQGQRLVGAPSVL